VYTLGRSRSLPCSFRITFGVDYYCFQASPQRDANNYFPWRVCALDLAFISLDVWPPAVSLVHARILVVPITQVGRVDDGVFHCFGDRAGFSRLSRRSMGSSSGLCLGISLLACVPVSWLLVAPRVWGLYLAGISTQVWETAFFIRLTFSCSTIGVSLKAAIGTVPFQAHGLSGKPRLGRRVRSS
jgi:hypothetical protein